MCDSFLPSKELCNLFNFTFLKKVLKGAGIAPVSSFVAQWVEYPVFAAWITFSTHPIWNKGKQSKMGGGGQGASERESNSRQKTTAMKLEWRDSIGPYITSISKAPCLFVHFLITRLFKLRCSDNIQCFREH